MDEAKEIAQQKKRLLDMAERSYRQNCYVFSGFLGLSEQTVFWDNVRDLEYAGYTFFGGIDSAERKMVRFGNSKEFGYEEEFPIVCIHIRPLLPKFADQLGHRDFLGALMNLGIERSTLGDLQIGEKEAFLFCHQNMAEYICSNLDKVKHTSVKCEVVSDAALLPKQEPSYEQIQVASVRIDACIAKVYHLSRTEVVEHFRQGKVFVDGRLCENNARTLKGTEVINLRGFGKFIYVGEERETKKGKLSVTVGVYR